MADEPVGIGSRREGRETVLGVLYEAEIADMRPSEALAGHDAPVDDFTGELIAAVDTHEAALDELLSLYAKGWTVDRMPVIDRLVLRMAAYELAYCPDVPTGVVLSEAVDLVSQYSTEKSATFVNGLLARIADEVR